VLNIGIIMESDQPQTARRYLPLVMLGVMWLAGCGSEEVVPSPVEPVPTSPKVARAAPAAQPEVAAAQLVEPIYVYRPAGRRDPFRSVIVSSGQLIAEGFLHPLQRYAVSNLRVIAILWGPFGSRAMLQTPDGKGYTIQSGTAVGNRNGVVTTIKPNQVVVEERYQDLFGEHRVETVALDLHPPEEGFQ
jgi:type IV pilus assembly protein PilP